MLTDQNWGSLICGECAWVWGDTISGKYKINSLRLYQIILELCVTHPSFSFVYRCPFLFPSWNPLPVMCCSFPFYITCLDAALGCLSEWRWAPLTEDPAHLDVALRRSDGIWARNLFPALPGSRSVHQLLTT